MPVSSNPSWGEIYVIISNSNYEALMASFPWFKSLLTVHTQTRNLQRNSWTSSRRNKEVFSRKHISKRPKNLTGNLASLKLERNTSLKLKMLYLGQFFTNFGGSCCCFTIFDIILNHLKNHRSKQTDKGLAYLLCIVAYIFKILLTKPSPSSLSSAGNAFIIAFAINIFASLGGLYEKK